MEEEEEGDWIGLDLFIELVRNIAGVFFAFNRCDPSCRGQGFCVL